MPKATLEFDLIEEQYEHACAVNGAKYRHLLEDIMQRLRAKRKYGTVNETTWEEAEQLVLNIVLESGLEVL